MHAKIEALQQVIAEIEALTAEADWDGLAALDAHAREVVEVASEAAKAGEIPVDVVAMQLDVLKETYEKTREKAVEARDEAASSLRETGRTHKAAQAYLSNQSKGH